MYIYISFSSSGLDMPPPRGRPKLPPGHRRRGAEPGAKPCAGAAGGARKGPQMGGIMVI